MAVCTKDMSADWAVVLRCMQWVAQGGGFPPGGGSPPNSHPPRFVPPGPTHGGFQGGPPGSPRAFCAPPTMLAQSFAMLNSFACNPAQAQDQQSPYSNIMKHFSNWTACYSCGFYVANGHTSILCPVHLHKAIHDIYFNCPNAQQYINLGYPCCTKNRHKTQFPTM
jgi:hypothetical protein